MTGDLLAAPVKGDRDVLEDSRATLETAMNDVTDGAENLMTTMLATRRRDEHVQLGTASI